MASLYGRSRPGFANGSKRQDFPPGGSFDALGSCPSNADPNGYMALASAGRWTTRTGAPKTFSISDAKSLAAF